METKWQLKLGGSKVRQQTVPISSDSVLTGTTLSVYRFLIKNGQPASAREIQRQMNLKSPSSAQFHLDKLERNGFVAKSNLNDGKYVVDRVLLNHYMKFKKFLFPRNLLYAILSTTFDIGWAGSMFVWTSKLTSRESYFLFYGVATSLILSGILWYETWRSAKRDRI